MTLLVLLTCMASTALQVQATHAYHGGQPDELSLEVSDVVNVLKKMADGESQMSLLEGIVALAYIACITLLLTNTV